MMEWDISADRTAYAASGQQEVYVLCIGNSDRLTTIAANSLQNSNLQRLAVTGPPPAGNLAWHLAGLPSSRLMSGPSYLVQVARDSNLGLINLALMCDQVVFCTKPVTNMVASPSFRVRPARPTVDRRDAHRLGQVVNGAGGKPSHLRQT
jgi:hypothetical protein